MRASHWAPGHASIPMMAGVAVTKAPLPRLLKSQRWRSITPFELFVALAPEVLRQILVVGSSARSSFPPRAPLGKIRILTMNSLRQFRISLRLNLILVLALLGMTAVAVISLWRIETMMLHERGQQTRVLVETVHSLLAHYHAAAANGSLDEAEAKSQAIAAVAALRYQGNYFWINDNHPRMVLHPIKSELNGKDLSTFKDPNGKLLFKEMVKAVEERGEGQVDYEWPKAGSDKPEPKVSYVKGFAPWGWIIGSGIYVDDVDIAFWKTARQFLLWGAVMMLGFAAANVLVARSIVKPVCGISSAMHRIACGDGDLTQRLPISGKDELTKLASNFNEFAETVRSTVADVNNAATQVASAAEQLSVSTLHTTASIAKQESNVEQVATAVTQMAATVSDIASSAAVAAEATRSADAEAANGHAVVNETIGAIQALSSEISAAGAAVGGLEEKSESIGSVLDVIRNIAEQTNLLALNAAIEAARAGEQGRGFAVVADEVRTLASRTQNSTREIQDMIQKLQEGARAAVSAMQSSQSTSKETVDTVARAGESLTGIVSAVASISNMTTQIATAAEEQSVVAQDVSRNIEGISCEAAHTSQATGEITAASRNLAELAEGLQAMVSRFRVS